MDDILLLILDEAICGVRDSRRSALVLEACAALTPGALGIGGTVAEVVVGTESTRPFSGKEGGRSPDGS